jgi:hypothetical protein
VNLAPTEREVEGLAPIQGAVTKEMSATVGVDKAVSARNHSEEVVFEKLTNDGANAVDAEERWPTSLSISSTESKA